MVVDIFANIIRVLNISDEKIHNKLNKYTTWCE